MLNILSAKSTSYIISGLLLLTVLPFLILVYFNHPTPEDFYYEEITKNLGFYDSQRLFFKFWGGRFSYYALISLNPLILNSFTGYNFAVLFLMIIFFIALYFFVSAFTKTKLSPAEILIFSASIIFLYLYSMPSVGQGFYWLGSAINYNLVTIFVFLFFIIYYRLNNNSIQKYGKIYSAICILLAIIIAGFNEISATIFSMSIIILFLKNLIKDKKFNWFLATTIILNLIFDYISFTAPGNLQRANQYTGNNNFNISFLKSLAFLFDQVFLWISDTPLIPVTFLLIPLFMKIVKPENKIPDIFSINPLYTVFILFLFLFTGIFLMMWSSGIVPYDRILNPLLFLFLIGWFYNVINLFSFFSGRLSTVSFKYAGYLSLLSVIIIFLFLIKDNNIKTAYSEMFNGSALNFKKELNERYNYLSQSNCDSCEIENQVIAPKSFFIMDIDENPKSVYNIGYALHFKKKSVVIKKNNK